MNIKELIEHLNQFNPEIKVMFSITDHTDWTSKIDIKKKDVSLGDILCDDDDANEVDYDELFDEDMEYIGPKVMLFKVKY